ncbi:uncharacterized protein J8A68_001502 [[Candida] subhashii]|uniref:Ribosomal protein n=1 Tax=[Candida] subhashii TaxID=561895 RepID=A0A8J5QNU1_9ASCO|nr:uncharacterized protein J8A68_001502 [[Candida] subhashii]KAG7664974.1 hypothetical protein J8A68_001502 [[Candida] subhashii]
MFKSGVASIVSKNALGVRSFSSSCVVLAKPSTREKIKIREKLRMKELAKDPSNHPLYMDIPTAMRYIRAAEVGNKAKVIVYLEVAQEAGAVPLSGNINFPHPVTTFNPIVFTSDSDKVEEFKKHNIVHVGGRELLEKVAKKEIDIDQFTHGFATPEIDVKSVARILGPKGIMPNAKKGTVTDKIEDMLKLGSMAPFRQKHQNLSFSIGTTNFSDKQILENLKAASDVVYSKFSSKDLKKTVVGKCALSSFQGPGIVIPFKQI